jgi:hypothetical protein
MPPLTSVLPTYKLTAPVAATAVSFGVSASMFPRVSTTVDVVDPVESADPYVPPAANPRTL